MNKCMFGFAASCLLIMTLAFAGCSGSGGSKNSGPATLASITIMQANPSIAPGTTQQFTALGTFTDNTTQDMTALVTWNSSNTSLAIIDSSGKATAVAAGPTTISATSGTISGTTTLTVTSATLLSIAVSPTKPTIAPGVVQQFRATGTYSDNTTQDLTSLVTWGSTAQATVDANGKATAVTAGTATITATLGALSNSTSVAITAATLQSIVITTSNTNLAPGSAQQFYATGMFSDNTTQDLTTSVTWNSSSPLVATISNSAGTYGKVVAVATGTTTISASLGGVSGMTTRTVSGATLQSITVFPAKKSIAAGTTLLFSAAGTYSDNTTQDLTTMVTWRSSDTTTVVISNAAGSNGTASAIASGAATITATLGAVSSSAPLTVTTATLVSMAITPSAPNIAIGTTQQFKVNGTFSDATTQDLTAQVTWSSSDLTRTIATISNAADSKGVATALGATAPTVTITAKLGPTLQATTTLTTSTLKSIAVTPANTTFPADPAGITQAYVATGTLTNAKTQALTNFVTWSSSDVTKAIISNAANSKGVATTIAAGKPNITATLGAISGLTTLTVSPATLVSIAVGLSSPAATTSGATAQFTATGTYSDATTKVLTNFVTWSSSNTSVAAISNCTGSIGMMTLLAPGTTMITATIDGIGDSVPLEITSF